MTPFSAEGISAADVIEAFDFLIKYPSSFSFEDIEDLDERDRMFDKYIHAQDIRSWYKKHGNGWLKEKRFQEKKGE